MNAIPPSALAAINAALGFNKLAVARDGLFIANINDSYVGRSLLTYGEYNPAEAMVLRQLVQSGDVIIEVGANIGSHTVGMARQAGVGGRVIAYEPQHVVFQTLCGNIALNSLTNVECYPQGVGKKAGVMRVPPLRYDLEGNFGGLSLEGGDAGLEVTVVRLDDAFKHSRLKLIKIDVEGMELDVIDGAHRVIDKFHPILYVENDRVDRSPDLIRRIQSLGYRLWWDLPPLFSPDNFAGNSTNIFGNVVSINMLCIHRSMQATIQHPEIENSQDHPLKTLTAK